LAARDRGTYDQIEAYHSGATIGAAMPDAKCAHLFDSVVEGPNKAVRMMALSQLDRNFATAPIVERADKLWFVES
jgi:hypothetical protein